MILSDKTIKKLSENTSNLIEPFSIKNLQPSSYDLTFSDEIIYPKKSLEPIKIPHDKLLLIEPNDFILGTTYEWINLPDNIVGRVEGKSSVARCGLLVHVTAGFIDPGFNGRITLELKNIGDYPIAIESYSNICQISFEELDFKCNNPYNEKNNHYQKQMTVKDSRYELINGIYYIKME